jgi:DNA helicase II / ATP-dependent DNA helicase PcrA
MFQSIDLGTLNPAQRAAAECIDGPLVIYAGAGSGKTKTIVHRIAHMISQGVLPSSMMAVTFTNKAAREMRERVEHLIGATGRALVVSTFHSACARFLRVYAKEAGYQEGFSIYDDDDQKSLLKEIFKELNVPEKLLSVQQIKSRIDKLKNAGQTHEQFKESIRLQYQGESDSPSRKGFGQSHRFGEEEHDQVICKAYELYQKKMKSQNAMDFNDLILEMVLLLENNELVRKQMQSRFRYFMVDEFQDTNPIQFRLISALSSHTRNLCIVGDDDQSIYSWRGAEPAFILDFNRHFAEAKVFKLEQNYRSTQAIVAAASYLISHNLKRAPKKLWTDGAEGAPIRIKTGSDAYDEANFVASEIVSTLADGAKLSQFAILYRTNAQSRALEDELRRRMLPYIIYGSVRFYERAEVKVLLAYLRLLVNPHDDAAFAKVINTPRRGFGDKALMGLKECAETHSLSLARAADRIANGELSHEIGRGVSALKEFSRIFINAYNELQMTSSPSQVFGGILSQIHFEEYVRTAYPEDAEERWLNVLELKNALEDFEHRFARGEIEVSSLSEGQEQNVLALFLEQAMLTVEPTMHNVQQGQAEAITLMTVHSAKGLEFDRVFITGLEEGTLPHQNSLESEAAVEEERRLMYVALTRARQTITLSYVRRHRFRPDFPTEPSRFLRELPEEHIEHVAFTRPPLRSGFGNITKRSNEMLAFGVQSSTPIQKELGSPYYVGQRVKHKLFGTGLVQGSEKSLDGWKIEVKFPLVGIKKLMHSYLCAYEEDLTK